MDVILKRLTIYFVIGGGGYILGFFQAKQSGLAFIGTAILILGYTLLLMRWVKG